jgi:predicted nucleotidyltransferase
MRRKTILQCLNQDQKALKQYGIKSLSLFGSVARGEEKETSDVDLIVAFNQPPGLFAFMELKDHLEGILNAHVDLVTEEALHPRVRKRILKETLHVM